MSSRGLTAVAVERLKVPAKGQVEHFDKGFPGLALRISYGGGRSFVFFYRIGGRQRRMTLGTYPAISLAEARELWRQARLDVARGRDPAIGRKRDTTAQDFATVAREWLTRVHSKNKSGSQVARIVEGELIPAWGHRNVADIGRRDILDLIDAIVDRGALVMARRVQSYVRALLGWCVGRGIIATDPSSHLPKPGKPVDRDRVLNDKELIAVWHGAEKLGPYGRAVQLLILTAARRLEIGHLKWDEIDDHTIALAASRTKNGVAHDIPLNAPALTLLRNMPRIVGCDFVFSTTGTTPIANWSRSKIRLDAVLNGDVKPWRLHDIRRTVATNMQKLGIGLQVVEAVLGHIGGSRAGIVGVYQRHNYADEKRAAVETWGKHVMALVT